jgi:hypothetical protein
LKEAVNMKTKVTNSTDGFFSGGDLLANQSEMIMITLHELDLKKLKLSLDL